MVLDVPQNGSVLSLGGQDGVEALLADHYFSPVFPLTSFFKLSYLHVNTKTNSNHIRMKLRSKIKIKTAYTQEKH